MKSRIALAGAFALLAAAGTAWTADKGGGEANGDKAEQAPASAEPGERDREIHRSLAGRWLWPRRGPGPDRGLLFRGYRSVPLLVGAYQLLGLRAGDRVDVLVTFDAKMAGHLDKVTATILQKVVVLGVTSPGGLEGKGVVTLLMNPNEAQYAALSSRQGEVHIVLRGEGDVEMRPMELASFRKLFR